MAEVITTIVYKEFDGEIEPVLSIKPKVKRLGHLGNLAIRQREAWKYARDKNRVFDKWMYWIVSLIYKQFDLGTIISPHGDGKTMSTRRMAEVATVIEDALDDLVKAPPYPTDGSYVEKEDPYKATIDLDSRKVTVNGIYAF